MSAQHPIPSSGAGLWKSRWPTVLLVMGDVAGFSLAWWLAYEIRRGVGGAERPINDFAPYQQVFPLVVGLGIANCTMFGLYLHRRRISSLTQWGNLLKAGYHYLLYLMVVGYFWKNLDLGRSVIMLCGALGFVHVYATRTGLRAMKERALVHGVGRVRAAIVGTGPLAAEVYEALVAHRDVGYSVVGYIRHDDDPVAEELGSLSELGRTNAIAPLIAQHDLEELFLAVPHLPQDEQLNLVNDVEGPGLRVHLVSNMFGVITQDANVEEIGRFPVVTLRDGSMPWHQAAAKRALDIAASSVGLVIWLLFFHWWIALLIKSGSPGPVLFVHERVGQRGKTFRLWKYRTMRNDASPYERAPTEQADTRITKFGHWLRHTSLDELPQLWNVLAGDMSMVGPRPEMPFLVEQYEAWQRRRLDVKPGITGLWQVIGRKNLPLHLNIEYDFYYIKNQSLLLDLEILIRTVPAVIKGRGAY